MWTCGTQDRQKAKGCKARAIYGQLQLEQFAGHAGTVQNTQWTTALNNAYATNLETKTNQSIQLDPYRASCSRQIERQPTRSQRALKQQATQL